VIEAVGIGAVFVVLAVAVFASSIRIGMLLGLRLDRSLEARASAGGDEMRPIDDQSGREESGGD
jgi:hypothetical protein